MKKGRGRSQTLTTPDLVVLSLLCERAMHGYELVKEYHRQEVGDWAAVSRPHVYYALKKLADAELITAQGADEKANRMVYVLTAAGRTALADALAATTWATERPPSPFLTWLGLSIDARPVEARAVIAARRVFLVQQIAKETVTLKAIEADDGMRSEVAAHMVRLTIAQFELELGLLGGIEQSLARAEGAETSKPRTPVSIQLERFGE
ncbi:PadR family transcriptional regulator [Rhizobium sp. PL01]|uniref:PadR family transcriptional regulator n=1 Tax=Rhizobium sp. PL01 TaxID=3085631 RepID=UPI00298128B1|nr:PadR family transcriptional regulator [Rhizobium sp. PL01]MDW5318393.1 PadR family transcriptional regulator [Rhizobium sp. PL01]